MSWMLALSVKTLVTPSLTWHFQVALFPVGKLALVTSLAVKVVAAEVGLFG
jgi:hypothetical protein